MALLIKKLFTKKTLILISKDKIRNFEISSFAQVLVLSFVVLVANLFYKSTVYNKIISEKSFRISKLQKANKGFNRELTLINSNLEKINSYFITAANYEGGIDSKHNIGLHDKQFDLLVADLDLEENYKKTAIEIASANYILDNVKALAKKRIASLESKITATGIALNEDQINNSENGLYDSELVALSLNTEDELLKQGGPFEEAAIIDGDDISQTIDLGTVDINDEINYLSNLEKFIYHAPLARPMEDYYVSSGFGHRVDPIKKVRASHNGMDFVGGEHAKVLSPSVGQVKTAGTFGAYGKTVIIDHGYGITTRYGHLYKINVKKGDIVKRGDVIALQGNSGRSTGSHLHYEVRYNNSPLNPRKFLKSGDNLFKRDEI